VKSNVPKDLGMTSEERKKLDTVLEEESRKLELLPVKTAPVAPPSFFQEVQAHLAADDTLPLRGSSATSCEIERVVVGEDRRIVREETVQQLMASIDSPVGLMHPIIITLARRLVDGAHRLEACRRLGWTEIPVTVKLYDAIQGEMAMLDANLCRNEFSAMERAEAISRRKILYEQLHPVTKVGGAPGKAGGGKLPVPKDAATASFAEDTEKKTGLAKRTVQDDNKIVKKLPKDLRDRIRCSALADNRSELLKLTRISDKDEQRRVALMVVDGKAKNVDDACRRERLRVRHEDIAAKNAESAKLEAGEGPAVYPIILADVPFRYKRTLSSSRDISNQYDDMPTEEIADIPVGDVAAQDCICFFWCGSSKIAEACEILNRWGFEVRSSMVWIKPSIGPGIWARIAHELVIIGVKGNPPPACEADKPHSVIQAPRGEHSEKPEALHLAIEKGWPSFSKLELFARKKRPGWRCLGNEIDGSDISVAIATVVARAGRMEDAVPRADILPSATEPAQDSATAPSVPPDGRTRREAAKAKEQAEAQARYMEQITPMLEDAGVEVKL
jgi:N6-adenosine-specific RNA methylase IME4